MITVINDRYYDESYNSLYEGMSLPEAAAQMVLECSQAINDLQMDTLLMEHSYLIENGEEIEYVTENDFLDGIKDKAGRAYDSAKAHGSVLINKIGMLIDKVATMIRELWEKAVDFVQEKITEFRRKLFTMGHSEKEYKELINNSEISVDVSGSNKIIGGGTIVSKVKSKFSSKIDGEHYTTDQVYAELIKDSGFSLSEAMMYEYEYMSLNEEPVFKGYNNYTPPKKNTTGPTIPRAALGFLGKLVYSPNVFIKQIRAAQKLSDTVLKKMKAEYGKTGVEASELADIYKGINERLKSNANVARAGVKAVNTSTISAMKIVAGVFKDLRKDKRDRDAKAAKDEAKKALADLDGTSKSKKDDAVKESYYYSGSNSFYSAYTL